MSKVKTVGIIVIIVGVLVLVGLAAQLLSKSEVQVSEDGSRMVIKNHPFGIGASKAPVATDKAANSKAPEA